MKKIIYILVAGIIIISACKSKKEVTETEAPAAVEAPQTETVKKGPPKGGSLEDRLAKQEEMYTSLGISDDQKVKFRAIETRYANKMRAARDAAGGDRDSLRSSLKTLQDSKMDEIKGILTVEQFTKFQTLLGEMRQERRGGRGR